MLENVSFTCSVQRLKDCLEVRYRIGNRWDDEIAVLDQIRSVGIDGAPEYSASAVYVDLEGAVLRLTKGALPLPEDLFPGVYPIPDARMIPPGGTCEEAFTLPIPVKVRNPLKRLGAGQVVAARKAVAREVVIGVGVVPSEKGCVFPRENPAFPDVHSVIWLEAKPGVQLECQTMFSNPFELDEDLPVLDYEVFPWP